MASDRSRPSGRGRRAAPRPGQRQGRGPRQAVVAKSLRMRRLLARAWGGGPASSAAASARTNSGSVRAERRRRRRTAQSPRPAPRGSGVKRRGEHREEPGRGQAPGTGAGGAGGSRIQPPAGARQSVDRAANSAARQGRSWRRLAADERRIGARGIHQATFAVGGRALGEVVGDVGLALGARRRRAAKLSGAMFGQAAVISCWSPGEEAPDGRQPSGPRPSSNSRFPALDW